jgi:hypothetical protein
MNAYSNVFTTGDYKSKFRAIIDDLFARVKYDTETGGELAFKHVHREPREGDYVILRGETKPVKYDEKAHKAEEIAAVLVSDRSKRIKIIDELTEAYVTQTGERPDHTQLDRLATLILREELTDDDPYKMSHEDDPILSDTQRGRRYKREKTKEDVITGRDKVIGYKRSWYETEDGEIREVRQKIYEYNAKHP